MRSTVSFSPRILGKDHGFATRADSIDSTPAMALDMGLGFVSAGAALLRTRSVGMTCRASELLEWGSWKSRIFREDVVEGLGHDIVGGGGGIKAAYWSTRVAVVSSKRTDALICRLWMISSNGIVVLRGLPI